MNIIPQKPVSNFKAMCLLPYINDVNIFALMPRTFKITTRNSSGIFNIDMLLITSSVISEFLKENPNNLQYHLDIDDEKNVLSKFENIYQGKLIEIYEDDIPTCEEITRQLNLVDFPNRMKPSDLNSLHYFNIKISFITDFSYYNLFDMLYTYKINQTSFIRNISKNNFLNRFTIQTNQNEYKCNIFGVLLSSVIHDFILKNPKSDRFIFDFDEEENEFQLICDLFNFQKIELTNDNSELIKEIAEELGIDSILDKINDFIEINERFSKEIDNQQNLIKKIDEIFDLLFNIDKKTVDFVVDSILKSEWSKNDENIYELAALILNVVKASSYLQKYIVDLLLKLNENEHLTNLLPFVIQNSINYFRNYFNRNMVQFIYKLYKRKLISETKLMINLEKINYNNQCINSWFLPEFIELKVKGQTKIDLKSENIIDIAQKLDLDVYSYCYNFNIEKFKEIRDKDEDDDTLLKSIREDDIDTFQSIVSQNLENFLNKNINTIFESGTSYLNYAAKFGSIKCFKFLLLNNSKIDVDTFKNAIIGGNSELIRIVDNKIKELNVNDKQFSIYINEALKSAIQMHRNDLFDWIFDSNSGINLFSLFTFSIDNCNTYSLVRILDKGFAFNDYVTEYSNFLVNSMKLGYYSLLKFLIKLIGDNMNKVILNKFEFYVYFGNIYIFKKFEDDMTKLHIIDIFYMTIKLGFLNMIEYIFEKYFSQISRFKKLDAKILLENCILSNSIEIFNYIIDKIEKYGSDDVESLFSLFTQAYKTNDFEVIKSLSELIYKKNPKIDFTTVLIDAIKEKKNKDLIKHFLNKKYLIYGDNVVKDVEVIKTIDMEIFHLLINNLNYTAKMILMNCLNTAIMACNIPLIEYLLTENGPFEFSLLKAVEVNNFEIVEMILKKNSEPSFVNKCSEKGTALNLAVAQGNLEIVKRLLSIPGIDLSIGNNSTNIPLINSILKSQTKIFESIVNFYGEDIQNQKWQIEKCFQSLYTSEIKHDFGSQDLGQILLNIINLNLIDLNYRFENHTLLTFALKNYLYDVAEELIKNEKVNVNSIDLETGNSPLMLAIDTMHFKYNKIDNIITSLINHKSIKLNHRNYNEMSALTFAVQFMRSEIVGEILKSDKFDPNEKDINLAFYLSNHYDTAKQLLTYNSIDVNYVPFQGQNIYVEINKLSFIKTPLIKAIMDNEIELFESIARHKTFDKVKSQYENAFFISIITNKKNFTKKFLEIFTEFDINSPLITGNTPLIEATINKLRYDNLIETILNDPNFDSKKSDIVKAFTFALKLNSEKYKTLYKFDSEHDHLIDQEIEKGGSSLLLNDDLSTETFNFLLNHGVDPNKPSKDGIYPLEYVILNDKKELFNILIDSNKIDFTKKILNKSGKSEYTTYLHLIASLGRDSMMHRFLFKKLCDINITDDLGDTPLNIHHYINYTKNL